MRTIFPTVIHEISVKNFKSIKKELIDFVYDQHQRDSVGVDFSNVGGWQSQQVYGTYNNILLDTVTTTLMSYFKKNVLDMSKEMRVNNLWININKKGDHNIPHNHPGCHIAGVFWIRSPPGCGNLEMQSPHHFTSAAEIERYTEEFQEKSGAYPFYMFPPTEGTILLFPASLIHRVDVCQSNEDRISAAFNLTFNL